MEVRDARQLFESYEEYQALQRLYQAALEQIRVKVEVLGRECQVRTGRNPIRSIAARMKSTERIISKLINRNYEVSLTSARQNLNDIAGIRVVCDYVDDVYTVAEKLLRQPDLVLLRRQDYIASPGRNGYRSLHLDVRMPIYLSDHAEYVNAEIQLRTVTMDVWAGLEQSLRGRKTAAPGLAGRLRKCAEDAAALDRAMQSLYNESRMPDAQDK